MKAQKIALIYDVIKSLPTKLFLFRTNIDKVFKFSLFRIVKNKSLLEIFINKINYQNE